MRPQFTLKIDFSQTYVGWYVDDVLVYTCDRLTQVLGQAKLRGQPFVGRKLSAIAKASPSGTTFSFQWLRNGKPIKGAMRQKYKLKVKDKGRRIAVVITGTKPDLGSVSVRSKAKRVKARPKSPHT